MLQQQLEEIRNNHYVMDTINMDSLISICLNISVLPIAI